MSEATERIAACRKHWQELPPHVKGRDTGKFLLEAIEIAERLFWEAENRQWFRDKFNEDRG